MTSNSLKIKLEDSKNIPRNLLLLADPSEDSIKNYINRGKCYAAYYNERIVGVYILINTRPHTMEIVNISVDESYQKNGIGKKLINHAIEICREEKIKVLEIGTGNSSLEQLKLYQKCGFRITGVDRDFFRIHYSEKIFENGIECVDMIRLSMIL